MAGNRVICHCSNVDYVTIRKAMIAGARTVDEIKEMTGAGTVCGGCVSEIEEILASVCGCKNVSLEEVVNAVKNGADTVEKVQEATGAGTECGRCNALIENIITLKNRENYSLI
ncbi:(2Fe-2S)-binding protein [Clostridium cylindrosporum]|uniref:Bacterioferritin-associated ferredoxin n=1 Tax=Clostridium cylindrosporum DSM 605 TaxID=1121307 RepID=A0A0J8D928_CLOCY|nr:(2Fe-2S)-binding protein [Clostridium cylindrosporum]KMT22525.1 BFD domain protein (2Fe-2S)-binding domain protein [Clostridium cylindrosporum DSM 605]